MRHRFLASALAVGALLATGPAFPLGTQQKNKLAGPPVLRVSPGYDYMAGDPNALSVDVKYGDSIWLVYYYGATGEYVGDPKGTPPGTREILVEASDTVHFAHIVGSMNMVPNSKGHILALTGRTPLRLDVAPGRSQTFYLRVRSHLGPSNPVTVKVSRSTPFAK